MGWEEDFLQDAVDTCTNASGEISDCPLFTIQDSATYSDCNFTVPTTLVKELVDGLLTTLPGDPTIAYGPAPANAGVAVQSSGAIVPTLSYSSGKSVATSATYSLGDIFIAKAAASDVVSSSAAAAVTVPTAAVPAKEEAPATTSAPSIASAVATQSIFSTEYQTSAGVVDEILWVEEVVTVTANSPARKRHLHKHRGVNMPGR